MPDYILVNSATTGKFDTIAINNRPHLRTAMRSIELDSVMNGALYTADFTKNRMQQLNALPAPVSHPRVNGELISARHPLAINSNGIGAMVSNPRIENGYVVNDLLIDIAVAEKSDDGKSVMSQIKAGKALGVSTGISKPKFAANDGTVKGRKHSLKIIDGEFDHVAILPNETPAGAGTFTINSDQGDSEAIVVNVIDSLREFREQAATLVKEKFGNALNYIYLRDVFMDSGMILFEESKRGSNDEKLWAVGFEYDENGALTLTDSVQEVRERVKRTVEPVNKPAEMPPITTNANGGAMEFKLSEFVLAIIGNTANTLTVNDKTRMEAMTHEQLASTIHESLAKPDFTVDQAKAVIESEGLSVNSADYDADAYQNYLDNRAGFDSYIDAQNKAREEKCTAIIGNSEMTKEVLASMPDTAIDALHTNLVKPAQDYSAQGQGVTVNSRATNTNDDAFDSVTY